MCVDCNVDQFIIKPTVPTIICGGHTKQYIYRWPKVVSGLNATNKTPMYEMSLIFVLGVGGSIFLYWGFGHWRFDIGVLSRDRPKLFSIINFIYQLVNKSFTLSYRNTCISISVNLHIFFTRWNIILLLRWYFHSLQSCFCTKMDKNVMHTPSDLYYQVFILY